MKSLNEFIGQELQWIHLKMLSSEYELRAGEEVLARLSCEGAFVAKARVETGNGSWIIERKGLHQTITILTTAGSAETESPTIEHEMSGRGTLLFPDGRVYRWQCSSFWKDVWTWLDGEGTPLLSLTRGAHVKLQPAASDVPKLALLVVLGWYLHKQQEEETAFVSSLVPIIG